MIDELARELENAARQQRPDGTPRYSKVELGDFFARLLIDLSLSGAELPDDAFAFLSRFTARIQVPSDLGDEEALARINAYFDAHPINRDLEQAFERAIRKTDIAHQRRAATLLGSDVRRSQPATVPSTAVSLLHLRLKAN